MPSCGWSLIDLFSSYRAAHFGVVSGFWLFAWLFSRVGGCYAVRLRGCLVKGAWVVFGLIRVVGSLLEQARPRVHSFSVVRQGLYRLDRIVGFPVLPTWSTAMFWSKQYPFRQALQLQCRMNHVASSLIPIVDEHSLIIGPVGGDLVSWIWKLKWAWVRMILLLPSLSVLAFS